MIIIDLVVWCQLLDFQLEFLLLMLLANAERESIVKVRNIHEHAITFDIMSVCFCIVILPDTAHPSKYT